MTIQHIKIGETAAKNQLNLRVGRPTGAEHVIFDLDDDGDFIGAFNITEEQAVALVKALLASYPDVMTVGAEVTVKIEATPKPLSFEPEPDPAPVFGGDEDAFAEHAKTCPVCANTPPLGTTY